MLKKIILTLFLVAIGIFSYFSYPIVKNRYFSNNTINDSQSAVPSENSFSIQNEDATEEDDSPGDLPIEKEVTPISESECEDECSDYSLPKEKTSCLEECKISATRNESKDCTTSSEAEKDSCWKEKAIKENKFEYCNNIENYSVKKSCKDRLIENILESQVRE